MTKGTAQTFGGTSHVMFTHFVTEQDALDALLDSQRGRLFNVEILRDVSGTLVVVDASHKWEIAAIRDRWIVFEILGPGSFRTLIL